MTLIETAKVTSKGQVTIPASVRKLLNLKEGESVAFGLTKEGVLLMPCKITTQSPYTTKEWAKLEQIVAENGKNFYNTEAAKNYIKNV
jgi:AbrB family looped-hinge helix DNA binding protein